MVVPVGGLDRRGPRPAISQVGSRITRARDRPRRVTQPVPRVTGRQEARPVQSSLALSSPIRDSPEAASGCHYGRFNLIQDGCSLVCSISSSTEQGFLLLLCASRLTKGRVRGSWSGDATHLGAASERVEQRQDEAGRGGARGGGATGSERRHRLAQVVCHASIGRDSSASTVPVTPAASALPASLSEMLPWYMLDTTFVITFLDLCCSSPVTHLPGPLLQLSSDPPSWTSAAALHDSSPVKTFSSDLCANCF
ncbi:uncharacterized protein LOC126986558 [Eriocheir sinensis]|uniref:uncharacterized protein LOC126986558 n=1 Tax=Eriocheir sinensis TaxID=95602 RepID=UPI0021C63CB0|nr:uncharacterized protein LOC126986558 [Eriocheir sinensis]